LIETTVGQVGHTLALATRRYLRIAYYKLLESCQTKVWSLAKR